MLIENSYMNKKIHKAVRSEKHMNQKQLHTLQMMTQFYFKFILDVTN